MTESEARKKWCPFARVTDENAVFPPANRMVMSGGRMADMGPEICCIASDCMAWRETSNRSQEQAEKECLHNFSGEANDGYCGLAGKP